MSKTYVPQPTPLFAAFVLEDYDAATWHFGEVIGWWAHPETEIPYPFSAPSVALLEGDKRGEIVDLHDTIGGDNHFRVFRDVTEASAFAREMNAKKAGVK